MSTRFAIQVAAPLALALLVCSAEDRVINDTQTLLQVKAFKLKGPTETLEELSVDFRYAPKRWQVCIGLPDDPHKSIVGSDGGLYYEYGGGRFHDFRTRVRAALETDGNRGDLQQRLLHPRIPVVITEQTYGNLVLRQRAWARAPQGKDIGQWGPKRMDYLWVELENDGTQPQRGRIVLEIDSDKPSSIDKGMQYVRHSANEQPFCAIAPRCVSVVPPLPEEGLPPRQILPQRLPSVSRNWGKPNKPCAERFRDVLVGHSRPLRFTFPAETGKVYHVAMGLLESWHDEAGKRPMDLRIEGQRVRKVDLVAEYGQHCPVVLSFKARDKDGNGRLDMSIHTAADAEDHNAILTALWVFDAEDAPTDQQILRGQVDSHALGLYEALSRIEHPLRLHFAETLLEPHQKTQVLVALARGSDAPLSASLDTAQQELDRAIRYWQEEVSLPYDRIQVPDPTIQGLLDSCIRNIYQARELRDGKPAFQVGPTCYRGTWAADGPFILEAVTYLGRSHEARAGLEVQVEKDEGPGGVAFSKKCGLRLWMILRHWQLTGDRHWLQSMWPAVEFNVNKIIEYRRSTMADPLQANYGLMPIGFGDGGLGGRHREYTNVYWTLAGLKAAIELALNLEKPMGPVWQAEFDDYWHFLDKARHRDKRHDTHGNTYVPVTMKGEEPQLPQRGAWAFLQSIHPGTLFTPEDSLMRGTLAMLDTHQCEGLLLGTGWDPDGIWNYAGSFYGHAHLWLGHGRKAAATLYAFANHACPLLCWREEHNPQGTPEKYIGDMPHNWASAEFIRMTRHLLILERDKELHFLEGIPTAWLHPGAAIQLRAIPTRFGPTSILVDLPQSGKSGSIRISPPTREKVERLVVHLEHFPRPVYAVLKDNAEIQGEVISTAPGEDIVLKLDF